MATAMPADARYLVIWAKTAWLAMTPEQRWQILKQMEKIQPLRNPRNLDTRRNIGVELLLSD